PLPLPLPPPPPTPLLAAPSTPSLSTTPKKFLPPPPRLDCLSSSDWTRTFPSL
ncbi:hypothetical protein COCCADRAFT_98033, partial [Bipolaris zeicola 26-R-13]